MPTDTLKPRRQQFVLCLLLFFSFENPNFTYLYCYCTEVHVYCLCFKVVLQIWRHWERWQRYFSPCCPSNTGSRHTEPVPAITRHTEAMSTRWFGNRMEHGARSYSGKLWCSGKERNQLRTISKYSEISTLKTLRSAIDLKSAIILILKNS